MRSEDLFFTKAIGVAQLKEFLISIDHSFLPKLSNRIDIDSYSEKLIRRAITFSIIHKPTNKIIACIAVYANNQENQEAYIPVLGTLEDFRKQGLIKELFQNVENYLFNKNYKSINLETWVGSTALNYYIKNGFYIKSFSSDQFNKRVNLRKELNICTESFPFNPTNLEYSDSLSNDMGIKLFIKRDDLFEISGGGSKGRKLMYILKKAVSQNCNAIVTTGSNQSNHIRSSAIMAANLNLKSSIVIHDVEPKEKYGGNLKLTTLAATSYSFIDRNDVKKVMDNEVVKFIENGKRPFYIFGGGHSVEGTYSYYKAVYELKNQLQELKPDFIIIASGTGSTQAGIEVAVRELYPKCQVIGISVARSREKGIPVIVESANELINKLSLKVEKFNTVNLDDEIKSGDYGAVTPQLIALIRKNIKKHGLALDPTYTGKAFLGLNKYINNGIIPKGSTVVFWHTGGLLNLLESSSL